MVCLLIDLLLDLLQPDRHLCDRTSLRLIFKLLILFGRVIFHPIARCAEVGGDGPEPSPVPVLRDFARN
ncbi:MAG: hypothetical protein ACMG55_06880 [Microcoleus sp.]